MPPRAPALPLGLLVALLTAGAAQAQTAPSAPVITEPATNGHVVSPADVHMETAPFEDADAGDEHACTDWEIWTVSPARRAWHADCVEGVERRHAHLGDGRFEGAYAGRLELHHETDYRLRVRFRDGGGLWSAYSERFFSTGAPTALFPMEGNGVAPTPIPAWTTGPGGLVVLPGGADPAALRLGSATGEALLTLRGADGEGYTVSVGEAQAAHRPLKLAVTGGSDGLALPASVLAFTDLGGTDRAVYLPPLTVAAGGAAHFWIALSGGTYHARAGDERPDFSSLAQGAPVPWRVVEPGYKVEVVASGFRLPVHIAFVPEPAPGPDAPLYYVTELYGTVKVVTRGGEVRDYATSLLNFTPTGAFPGSGEQGLSGIVVDPATGDVLVATLYDAAPPGGPHYPKVLRLRSTDGGLTASEATTVLDMAGESQGQSHFISSLSIGPDGRLYVHMGDGFDASTALNLDSFRGKILRVGLDGTPPPDNPFYDPADGLSARDFVYAYGLRNPFGGAWRRSDGALFSVENGPGSNDRLARIEPGRSYGWDGTDASMTTRALYTWVVPHAPVAVAFAEPGVFGGSGFPAHLHGDAFVTESGPTWASGPQARGKRIVRFRLGPGGAPVDGPHPVVEYSGSGKASASALAAGPDGLYFADLYRDRDYTGPTDRGAHILRLAFVGAADFAADVTSGPAPLTVRFTDRSTAPGAVAWRWSFGDGATSDEQHPEHTYREEGAFAVRLEVTGENGVAVAQRNAHVVVGNPPAGLRAAYFATRDLSGPSVGRIDPTVDFDWGTGAPLPGLPGDDFSVRWTGQVEAAATGLHTFTTVTDDGVRLWIDDRLLIDRWIDQSPTEHHAEAHLVAGRRYNVRMEYYERGVGAVARLLWTPPGGTRAVIPQDHLYPLLGEPPAPPAETARLAPPYPNPFRYTTSIRFAVPESGHARVVVYDLLGREVARLFDGWASSNTPHEVYLDGAALPAGVYLLQLRANGETDTRTLVHVSGGAVPR